MVPDRELTSKGHYLPHHPVLKPDSVPTKLRPVFDASCNTLYVEIETVLVSENLSKREEFWIIGARRTRSVVKQCARCKRFSAKPPTTALIQLPLDSVRDALEVTGVDLCGSLILKSKNKSWVVLFTCAVYRCVHLELVTFISTECFNQAFRRFIDSRGRPTIVYPDNGTNFVGASAGLKKVDWEKVVSQETLNPITWKFIPPTAAWWERLIRSAKNLIVRVLGQASVNYEELLTIL
ncbi:integrase catalytic domain-containing protein [Trichonephila clavipes]|nr:integrase catalytic domain-containing protein [Trichonephila clavipes]